LQINKYFNKETTQYNNKTLFRLYKKQRQRINRINVNYINVKKTKCIMSHI